MYVTNGGKELKFETSLLTCFTGRQLHLLRKNIKKIETDMKKQHAFENDHRN
jgi:hypothetical protein